MFWLIRGYLSDTARIIIFNDVSSDVRGTGYFHDDIELYGVLFSLQVVETGFVKLRYTNFHSSFWKTGFVKLKLRVETKAH